jgi:hypothetical protein
LDVDDLDSKNSCGSDAFPTVFQNSRKDKTNKI